MIFLMEVKKRSSIYNLLLCLRAETPNDKGYFQEYLVFKKNGIFFCFYGKFDIWFILLITLLQLY